VLLLLLRYLTGQRGPFNPVKKNPARNINVHPLIEKSVSGSVQAGFIQMMKITSGKLKAMKMILIVTGDYVREEQVELGCTMMKTD
jgi:hypothetical protein